MNAYAVVEIEVTEESCVHFTYTFKSDAKISFLPKALIEAGSKEASLMMYNFKNFVEKEY